jgi:amino acid transporter
MIATQYCRSPRNPAQSTRHRRMCFRSNNPLAFLYSSVGSLVRLVCASTFCPGKQSLDRISDNSDLASQIYALALGKGPSVFMTILAVVGLILNASIATVAASRLVFAVARDGVLPFSSWVGTVTDDGRPKNAVTVMYCFGAILLCTILPSNVAFTSLVSAGGIREFSELFRCDFTDFIPQRPSRLTPSLRSVDCS